MKLHYRLIYIGILLVGLSLACSFPSSATEVPAQLPLPSETATVVPVATATPTVAAVQHVNIPGELPEEHSGYVGDQDSSITADQKRAPGGDRFTFNRFERPFNAETMDVYFPYLDIQEATIYLDDTWLFAVIKLKAQSDQGTLPGRYALELDLNLDGGGEWFVLADSPASTEWTVDGVQAWNDTNDDVGGLSTMLTDKVPFVGDGYETMVFDQGTGDDPDAAWTRISPDDPSTVQIALKRSQFDNDSALMASVWAGTEDLDPALFELSDSYTHDRAGTSLIDLEIYYPIKEISELDSACRVPIGFAATGNEPGLCPVAPPAAEPGEPGIPDQPGCTGQTVCFNFGNQRVCYCLQN